MDNGAHYFRSDFQVHTPRDINWKGHRAVTDDERQQYAHDFVACGWRITTQPAIR